MKTKRIIGFLVGLLAFGVVAVAPPKTPLEILPRDLPKVLPGEDDAAPGRRQQGQDQASQGISESPAFRLRISTG